MRWGRDPWDDGHPWLYRSAAWPLVVWLFVRAVDVMEWGIRRKARRFDAQGRKRIGL